MKISYGRKSRRLRMQMLIVVVLLFWSAAKLVAQASGPQIDECSSAVLDSYGVEQSVCVVGNASGLTVTDEVDNYAYTGNQPSSPAVAVGAQAEIIANGAVVANSGDQQGDSSSQANIVGFIPQLNTNYAALGLYDECLGARGDYDPDDCSNWSTGMTGLQLQVEVTQSTSISIAGPVTTVIYGSPATFTATIYNGPSGGNITFYNGTTLLCTSAITVNAASCTTSSLPAGSNSITANWAGNSTYGAATSPAYTQVVEQATPVLTLVSSLNPAPIGASLTLTASIANGPSTGTISFYDGSAAMGTSAISGTSAVLAIGTLPLGNDAITAVWSGDPNYAPTTSAPLTQDIVPPIPVLTLASSSDPSSYGNAVTFTATISDNVSGVVTFYGDQTAIGTGTISGSTASFTTSSLPVGTEYITVSWPGDGTFSATTSQGINQTVNPSSPLVASDIYYYRIVDPSNSSGYDPASNVINYTDSVNGSWSNIAYDDLNRISSAVLTTGGQTEYLCWSYDEFGNRLGQSISSAGFTNAVGQPCQISGTVYENIYSTPNDNNQIVSSNSRGTFATLTYDADGRATFDGSNSYLYDAEGRICAVIGGISITGGTQMTGYLYDARGDRVAKGTITSASCDITTNGFTVTNAYGLNLDGEQASETDGAGNWKHSDVSANGRLLATYDDQGVHFHIEDWLGTRRVQANYLGMVEGSWSNMPYGDMFPNTSPPFGATEKFFTGKERDQESGLDYFGARDYASSMGRFMSPDPTIISRELENPQSWNKFGYAFNNPLKLVDPDGKWPKSYHEIIIDNNFRQYGKHATDILKARSAMTDSLWTGQWAHVAYKHAMSSPFSGWDDLHGDPRAIDGAKTQQYISDKLTAAVNAQISYESQGGKGYSDATWSNFGDALHPETDSASPEHAGQQSWSLMDILGVIDHVLSEDHDATSADPNAIAARDLANKKAAALWKRFNAQLDQARKDREKKLQ